MEYKKYVIDNVEIYTYKTDKFKTIKINMMFINEYSSEDILYNNLLNKVLYKSTKTCNNEIKMNKKYMELYSPGLRIFDMYKNISEKNFQYTFLNEKYTEKEQNKNNIDFLFDIIFNPNIKNKKFEKNNFLLCKNDSKINYNLALENPNFLVDINSFSNISEDLPSKILMSTDIKKLDDINEKNLYNYYINFLNTSSLKIFIVGDINEKQIINILKDKLKNFKFKNNDLEIQEYTIINKSITNEIRMHKDFNQSILKLIYKVLNITDYERKYVFPLFNIILGGNNFKLYKNVREKNSLSYYIYSRYNKFESIFSIECGIKKENYNKTLSIIYKQLKNMQESIISNKELRNAKEIIIASENNIYDNLNSILSELINVSHLKTDDNEEYIKKIKSVKISDIVNLANKINLDVLFFLEGN